MIPGTSKIVFAARCPTIAELAILKVRVEKCFAASALATGCEYKHDWVMAYSDLRNNEGLAGVYCDFMGTRYGSQFPDESSLGGSTDFVSLFTPRSLEE